MNDIDVQTDMTCGCIFLYSLQERKRTTKGVFQVSDF